MLSNLWGDLRYAARSLSRAPGITTAAIVTIALGIGATTAIFSVVDALLIRSLSYPQAERLVALWVDATGRGMPRTEWTNVADTADWAAELRSVESLYAYRGWGPTLTGGGEPVRLAGTDVTHEFFDVLGVRPLLGRGFTAEDDVPNGPAVIIVSHEFWQRRLSGDADVIGRAITLDGRPWTVIGVMPPGFAAPRLSNREVWKPLQLSQGRRGGFYLRVVGRLAPGATVAEAEAELDAVQERLAAAYPETNANLSGYVQPLQEVVSGPVRTQLLLLLGATAFVLLITCANVANLLLARTTARNRELAVRAALGAARARLARQLLTESAVLALLGGVVGLAVASGLLAWLAAELPYDFAGSAPFALDTRVLSFALTVSVGTGLLFGSVPALATARRDVAAVLRDGDRTSTGGRLGQRMRAALVVGNFALALALTIGAGLFLKSFSRLMAVDPGFEVDGLLTLTLSLPEGSYAGDDEVGAFQTALRQRLASQPGLAAVGFTSTLPFGGRNTDTILRVEPSAGRELIEARTWYSRVTVGYHEALGARLERGRGIDTADRAGAPDSIVINEAFAREYFPGEDPLGRSVTGGPPENPVSYEVVGVVGDIRFFGLDEPQTPSAYFSLMQRPERQFFIVARVMGEPLALLPIVRSEIAALDPNLPVNDVAPMTTRIEGTLRTPRLLATLIGAFAALALVLSGLGVYGTIAYGVTLRTREFGVRIALGARRKDVLLLVLHGGLRLAGAGLVLGLVIALALGRVTQAMLYSVDAFDTGVFVGVSVLLLAVAALASISPAWRASRVEPTEALRWE